MRIPSAAAIIALLTGILLTGASLIAPAYAQKPAINLLQDNSPPKTQEQKDAEAARDQAYKESLRKIPDAKVSSDPWGNVRTDAPKKTSTAVKPQPKSQTKTGSAAN
ncbi:MAG: hypothetical protein E7813_07165 [Bradyrhizobium sp.]|uniref:hypothetical protein n=1 Tax=Bradyrhizobium sp. TaxID=376 RepID=UPI0011FF7CB9|nr:hypothetical protein [Bradyrhizobium sp.]THD70789.1 MAG: hypothetical protein E7813_07165 [Bradyrhizobium sp.]